MSTECNIYVNVSTSDSDLGTSGANFALVDIDNDRLIFSAGSDSIADGEASPSDTQLNQAGVLLTGEEIVVDKYFLDDTSLNQLRQIHNMGAGNYQHVLAFDFNGATASEPVLEIWDDTGMDSIDLVCLGEGVASSSWFRGITTTSALPGAGWTGSRLAGSADGYFLWLNDGNGALSVADTLYCQLKIIIPSTQVDAGAAAPVIAVKFATV